MPEFLYPERVFRSKEYTEAKGSLIVPFGVTEFDEPVVHDFARFPHLLIAGHTHSGKSTFLHNFITSLIVRYAPEDLCFILIDPKSMEMTAYDSSPHMLVQPITESKRAVSVLYWLGKEMERRYELLKTHRVMDINEYRTLKKVEHPMPYIVAVIDELADIMQAYPRELECAIVKLAQKSRAVGIHLVLSTQSPRAEVVTGLIKANMPARIAFKVSSSVDSRIIIDTAGAERLSGKGDGLLVVHGETVRFQTPLITRSDVRKLIERSIKKYGKTPPPFNKAVSRVETYGADFDDSKDELYDRIEAFVIETGRASTSLIQRKFKVGFGRAARLMDILEEHGVISPSDGTNKPRMVIKK
jgi:S-DNA-T family DNA segregation ATPase FtsK/SpoIIIE